MPSSKLCDHRLAAARIAADRVDGDGIVRRHEAGIDQRPQQRHRAGRIAAGIGDFSRRLDLVGLIGREFRKTIGPVGSDPKRRRGVEHLGRLGAHAVDQRDGLFRGIVRQAEDDEIHLLHQRLLGAGILALLLGDALDRDVVLQPQPLGDAEARGAGRAVDEHGGFCRRAPAVLGCWVSERLITCSLQAKLVSLVVAAKACGRASRISCAMVCEPGIRQCRKPIGDRGIIRLGFLLVQLEAAFDVLNPHGRNPRCLSSSLPAARPSSWPTSTVFSAPSGSRIFRSAYRSARQARPRCSVRTGPVRCTD